MRVHLLPKLRCYFAEFLNQSSLKRLVYSTSLPVSVCGTVTNMNVYEDFPGSMESITLCPVRDSSSRLSLKKTRIYLSFKPTRLNHLFQQAADLSFSVPPYTSSIPVVREY